MGNLRYVILHLLSALIACITLLGILSPLTFAQTVSEDEVYDVILELKRDRNTLATAVFALEKNGKYYVPVQELARIVNFQATTSLKDGIVKGFFFSEENSYSIDARENIYILRGKPYSFDPSHTLIFSQKLGIGDIYVTTDLLNNVWPLDLHLDPLKQTLEIQTKRKLPYELTQTRQRKRNFRLNKNADETIPAEDLVRLNNQYKMFSLPAVDVSSTTKIGGAGSGIGQNVNIRGRNDLLNAEASYNFTFDKEQDEKADFSNARFVLERKSYEEGDLPMNLQLMQLGDVRPRPSRLIDGVLVGRGFLVSSEPQKRTRDFDQITVEGEAEPGWEVELYRGNELVDFQIVDDQGEYRFENVSLNFTETVIRTVLYGPEGQVRETEKTYKVSDVTLKPGKTTFEASVQELNTDLIKAREIGRNQPTGFASNFEIKRGIKSWLTTFASFTRTPTRDDDRNYITLGSDVYFKGVSGLAEVYKDLSGGTAYDLRTATNVEGVNVNLRTAFFDDFQSEEANFGGSQRKSRTEFSLSRPFQTLLGSLGLRFKLDDQRFKDTPDRTQIDFSQTLGREGLRITHGNTINLNNRSHQTSDGRINTFYNITRNWQLRSLLNYDIFPDKKIRNLLSEIRYRDGNKFTAAVDINRNFQDQGTNIGGQIAYDFEKFRLGLNTDWEKENGFRALLRASFSAAPYGLDDDYIFSSKSLSNRTALNGHVFLDKNYDGKFNEGDEPIKDAIIDIGRRETDISDNTGLASYVGSIKNEYENITLNTDSLNNPFTLSTNPGYDALLRPAHSTYVEFPVIETGIIEGTIEVNNDPIPGASIELLYDDQVIDSTTSAFDGFYVFEYVEPGSYIVRVDPSYEQIDIPPRPVSVTSENLFLSNIDFQIFEQTDEVACPDEENDDGGITQDCPSDSEQDGVQSAHTNSKWQEGAPTVKNVRMAQRPKSLRLVLDYDQEPNPYEIIETLNNKEISIILPKTNWGVNKNWQNEQAKILKEYSIEHLPNGDTKIILRAVDKIKVKEKDILKPNKQYGHRIYFDLTS